MRPNENQFTGKPEKTEKRSSSKEKKEKKEKEDKKKKIKQEVSLEHSDSNPPAHTSTAEPSSTVKPHADDLDLEPPKREKSPPRPGSSMGYSY